MTCSGARPLPVRAALLITLFLLPSSCVAVAPHPFQDVTRGVCASEPQIHPAPPPVARVEQLPPASRRGGADDGELELELELELSDAVERLGAPEA